jgi:hypothetical protein
MNPFIFSIGIKQIEREKNNLHEAFRIAYMSNLKREFNYSISQRFNYPIIQLFNYSIYVKLEFNYSTIHSNEGDSERVTRGRHLGEGEGENSDHRTPPEAGE